MVKLGTAVLTGDDGALAEERCRDLLAGLAQLRREGRDVVLVSSGAVQLGAQLSPGRRNDSARRRAHAAIGQAQLMAFYVAAFAELGLPVAQLLLTARDFATPQRRLQLRRTLDALLERGAMVVINENDAVTAGDTAQAFGDNDRLAALVAAQLDAGLLLILTDVAGLHTGDPRHGKTRLISLVERVTADVERLAGGAFVGRGGMRTKVAAAACAARSGCATILAGGRQPNVIDRVFAGEEVGTLFLAEERPAPARAASR